MLRVWLEFQQTNRNFSGKKTEAKKGCEENQRLMAPELASGKQTFIQHWEIVSSFHSFEVGQA